MLYRRFTIVAFIIALFVGIGMANLIHLTKEHRDIVREYPGMFTTKTAPCTRNRNCLSSIVTLPFQV